MIDEGRRALKLAYAHATPGFKRITPKVTDVRAETMLRRKTQHAAR